MNKKELLNAVKERQLKTITITDQGGLYETYKIKTKIGNVILKSWDSVSELLKVGIKSGYIQATNHFNQNEYILLRK